MEADLCEWTHCADVVDQLGLTPFDAELKVPACFRKERREELKYRRGVIDNVLGKLGFLEKREEKPKMTEQQAILIIQVKPKDFKTTSEELKLEGYLQRSRFVVTNTGA